MIQIKAKDYISEGFSYSDGEVIQSAVDQILDKGESVAIDFSNIDSYTALFFKIALIRHLGSMTPDEYESKIKVENLSELGNLVYNQCYRTAVKFYRLTPEEQEIHTQCIREMMEDLGVSE
ncbi:STAS-like domain-containing protein [Methanolapillus millepedarum]|uniref:DUF4325 domain-containing protein n=1 Tax=Methanolapillus millepedarum TaxID=3028296 RepID=A0AA96V3D6_9EURY|nr:hypothetical protein MsAc7_14030 [Methanosarcinaceae archaeon Ac7]